MKAQDLKDAYYAVRIDGRYDLYDKDPKSGSSSCHKYLGSVVYDSKNQSVMFNGQRYTTIQALDNALKEWEKSLPFSVENYNPMFNEKYRTERCIGDYLQSIGFVYNGCDGFTKSSLYILNHYNPYFSKQVAVEMLVKVDDSGKTSSISLHYRQSSSFVTSDFDSLEEAIATINSLIEPLLLCGASEFINKHNKISKQRKKANLGEIITVNFRTLQTYSEDLKAKTIEALEEALKRLKEE